MHSLIIHNPFEILLEVWQWGSGRPPISGDGGGGGGHHGEMDQWIRGNRDLRRKPKHCRVGIPESGSKHTDGDSARLCHRQQLEDDWEGCVQGAEAEVDTTLGVGLKSITTSSSTSRRITLSSCKNRPLRLISDKDTNNTHAVFPPR